MRSLLGSAVALAAACSPVRAQTAGSFVQAGSTLVSAMMMFLGNDETVYILDKTEGNAAQINGHPAWGAYWDIATRQAGVMEVVTNTFCASGMHLPNGSFVTFGGNGAIGPNGAVGSVFNASADTGEYDATYQDYDGGTAIRILNPCPASADFTSTECAWYDDPSVLHMQSRRWYAGTEALGDGSIVLLGGFTNGGYINRNYPNTDPTYEGGGANPTYEFYPSRGAEGMSAFMTLTSGLNSYAHMYLLASGHVFVQANYSTIVWDVDTNVETPLPDMPGDVVRVYPASGAVAMLPMTPANNYTQTILFCGGSNMPDADWGDYSWPAINTWDYPASSACDEITPEPQDGSAPVYTAVDSLPGTGRSMGQFLNLPDGTLLVINGAENGTAGYAQQTGETATFGQMGFGMSLSTGPVLQPAIYNPAAPQGSRWSQAGLDSSTIPRLYHSGALLLPDASVLIAGSNPNVDVNLTTVYPTTYEAEIFYPSYFSAPVRPSVSGAPSTLTYGGPYFNLTLSGSSYSGSANNAAENTTVVLIRPGFTTHAMNMGQRYLQLNSTYTVNSDASITLHVSPPPPNPNLLSPGPALLFVVVGGIPSNGTTVIVGNGQVGTQPTQAIAPLPSPVTLSSASGSGGSNSSGSGSGSGSSSGGKSSDAQSVVMSLSVGVLGLALAVLAMFA